jgi:hypothetical protein
VGGFDAQTRYYKVLVNSIGIDNTGITNTSIIGIGIIANPVSPTLAQLLWHT